ncbi:unnamed protein product [Haemonchus placei]|uniref:Uncharacterized protein n=1 Tax=Haemonchus placei TaxID=6290 RepID=A0A0N4X0A7_HAEPC|nr:unnamed protein product [Haemonchus placei]
MLNPLRRQKAPRPLAPAGGKAADASQIRPPIQGVSPLLLLVFKRIAVLRIAQGRPYRHRSLLRCATVESIMRHLEGDDLGVKGDDHLSVADYIVLITSDIDQVERMLAKSRSA